MLGFSRASLNKLPYGEVVLQRICLEPIADEPALAPFLGMLRQDIGTYPERLQPITADLADHLRGVVGRLAD